MSRFGIFNKQDKIDVTVEQGLGRKMSLHEHAALQSEASNTACQPQGRLSRGKVYFGLAWSGPVIPM